MSTLTSWMLQPLMASKCITCVAQETENGWWYFSGIIGGLALVVAGVFLWMDRRERASWPQLPNEIEPT